MSKIKLIDQFIQHEFDTKISQLQKRKKELIDYIPKFQEIKKKENAKN